MPDYWTAKRHAREREAIKNEYLRRGLSPEEAQRKAEEAIPPIGGAPGRPLLDRAMGLTPPGQVADLLRGEAPEPARAAQGIAQWAQPAPRPPAPRVRERGEPGRMSPVLPPVAIPDEVRDYVSGFRNGPPAPEPAGTMAAAEAARPTSGEKGPLEGQLPLSGRSLAAEEADNPFLDEEREKHQPYALEADRSARQRRSGTLRMVQGILEGIGGRGRSGTLQEAREKFDDELGAGEIAFLNRIGIPVQEGMTLSRLEKLLPGGYQNPFALALRERALDQGERRLGLSEQSEGRMQRQFERVPDQDRRRLADQKKMLSALDRVEEGFRTAAGETGPIIGRINNVLFRWGFSGPEIATLQSELGTLLANYVRSVSGAQVHVQEFERLKVLLPQMAQRGDTFQALINRYRKMVQAEHTIDLDYLKRQGRDVEPFGPGAGAGEEEFEFEIPASDTAAIEEAKRRGARFRVIE